MAIIYQHFREDKNCVFYIGYASEDAKNTRPFTKFSRSKLWINVVSNTSYTVQIILDGLSDKDAFSWEQYLIGLHGKRISNNGHLVNISDGGEGCKGIRHTNESKNKLSCLKKALFQDKTKHPMYGRKGPDNPNYGRNVSNDTIVKISKANSGSNNGMHGKRGGLCPNSKSVTNGYIVWGSTIEAADYFGVKHQYISKMILGQRRNKFNLSYCKPNK